MSEDRPRSLPSFCSSRILAVFLLVIFLAAFQPLVLGAAFSKTSCAPVYLVKRGDTLNSIASQYGRTASEIVAFNAWKKPYTIYVGQQICIPQIVISSNPEKVEDFADLPAAYFVAGRKYDNTISIYTYTYPETTVLVKVADASSTVRKFYTLGSINLARTGNAHHTYFKLPPGVPGPLRITICLKDRKTSYLQCVYPTSAY